MNEEKVIHYLEERVLKNPKSLLFARLADCYLSRGRIDEAIKLCSDGIKHHPDYITGYFILSKAWLIKEDYEKAETELKRVLSRDRQFITAHKLLADLMMKMGWENTAAMHFKDILKLDPLNSGIRNLLSTLDLPNITSPAEELHIEPDFLEEKPKDRHHPRHREENVLLDELEEVFGNSNAEIDEETADFEEETSPSFWPEDGSENLRDKDSTKISDIQHVPESELETDNFEDIDLEMASSESTESASPDKSTAEITSQPDDLADDTFLESLEIELEQQTKTERTEPELSEPGSLDMDHDKEKLNAIESVPESDITIEEISSVDLEEEKSKKTDVSQMPEFLSSDAMMPDDTSAEKTDFELPDDEDLIDLDLSIADTSSDISDVLEMPETDSPDSDEMEEIQTDEMIDEQESDISSETLDATDTFDKVLTETPEKADIDSQISGDIDNFDEAQPFELPDDMEIPAEDEPALSTDTEPDEDAILPEPNPLDEEETILDTDISAETVIADKEITVDQNVDLGEDQPEKSDKPETEKKDTTTLKAEDQSPVDTKDSLHESLEDEFDWDNINKIDTSPVEEKSKHVKETSETTDQSDDSSIFEPEFLPDQDPGDLKDSTSTTALSEEKTENLSDLEIDFKDFEDILIQESGEEPVVESGDQSKEKAPDLSDEILDDIDKHLDEAAQSAKEKENEEPQMIPASSPVAESEPSVGDKQDSDETEPEVTAKVTASSDLKDQTKSGEEKHKESKIVSPTLGEIYAAQGEYAKAIKVYEVLLEKNPNEKKYQKKIDDLKKRLESKDSK